MTVITPTDDPRYPDAETKKIAEELEKQGIQLPFKSSESPAPKDDLADDDENGDDNGEDAKKEQPEKKEDKKPEKEKAEPKSDEAKADNPDDKKPDDKQPKRQVMIPIARVKQAEKELRTKLEQAHAAQISELTNQVKELQEKAAKGQPNAAQAEAEKDIKVEELTKVANSIAEKHDTDPELVKDIIAAVQNMSKQGVDIPKELTEAVEIIKQNKANADAEEADRRQTEVTLSKYEDEFHVKILANPTIAAEIRNAGLTMDQYKERLQELVLGEAGERYATLDLDEVHQLKKADLLPKKAKSAESQHTHATSGSSDSGRELSAEEINAMSPEEFAKFSDSLGKRGRSRVSRNGRPIN